MNPQRLLIAGHLPMTKSEAQSLIDAGRKVMLHLWGEGPYNATISATAGGLAYQKELVLLGTAPAGVRPRVEAKLA